ncbi:MAG: hypothetical protein WC378_15505 [Opitutaceae bacterium]|jgi:hypothetical protein
MPITGNPVSFTKGSRMKVSASSIQAAEAQKIYAMLVSVGWNETLVKFKPESLPKLKPGTVGEVTLAARGL